MSTGKILIGRGDSGGGSSSKGIEQENTLQTNTIAKIVDLIGEGEIGGPAVDGDIYKSTFFNDIPVHNPDGSANFKGISLEFRPGSSNQGYIEGFNTIENTVLVTTQVLHEQPIVRTITDPNVDHCKITLSIPALMHQKDDGEIAAAAFQFAVYVTSENGSAYKYQVISPLDEGIVSDKCTSETRLQFTIKNLIQYGQAPWVIEVERFSPDSNLVTYVSAFSWYSYTSVIDSKLNYCDRAVVASTFSAKQFGDATPSRAWRLNGRKIKIPSNYDPIARTYSGDWDGSFVIGVTNNPAWIVYDLLTDPIVGLGHIITEDMVDKWALYSCAQYNDAHVPKIANVRQADGSYTQSSGETEPRFSFNGVLQARNQGLESVAHVCGAMNAFLIWVAGQVSFVQDRPITTPSRPVSISNVSEDGFQYTGIPRRNRHTVVKVSYNNPDLLGKLDVIELVDDQAITEFGYNEFEFAAIGCYSKTEAIRKGKYALDTDVNARETVSFTGGLEWADAVPGELMQIQDPNYAAVTMEGRVKSGTTTSLVLDKELPAMDPAQTYTMFLQTEKGGGVERELIVNTEPSDTLTWSVPLAEHEYSFVGAVLVVSASNLRARPFVLLTATEEDGFYNVTGIQYDPDKWARVEYGIITDPPIYTALLPNLLLPPTNINVVGYTYTIGDNAVRMRALNVSWTASTDPRTLMYEYSMISSLGARSSGQTTDTTIDWKDAGEGIYNIRVRAVGIGIYSEWLTWADFELNINFADLEPKTVLEQAELDAATAKGFLDEWASDGKFTVLEKTAMREGWLIRTEEFLSLKAQAETFEVDPALITALSTTFDAWGTYLNGGADWTPPATYPPLDIGLPLWIQTAQLPITVDIDRETFNQKAEDYFTALINLKYAVAVDTYERIITAQAAAEQALADAADALANIDEWAVDGYFSPVEKAAMNSGWIVRTEEYLSLKAQAEALGIAITPLESAFDAWGTYLNGGAPWTIPTSVSDATMPSWIQQANLDTAQEIVRSEFVGVAEVYFAALTAMKISLSTEINNTISAIKADTDNAKTVLDEWASDGKFTVNEKTAFREGWFIRTAEYLETISDAEGFGISTTSFIAAFDAWGTYLNAGNPWTPPDAYPPSDASLPLWIQTAQLPVTVNIVRSTFNTKAESYFSALITIKNAINGEVVAAKLAATEAAADAANALGVLGEWSADNKFSVNEKTAMREGWFARTAEYLEVKAQAATFSISSTTLVSSFDAWGTYLNAGSSWTPPASYPPSDASLPLWIQTAQLTVTVDIVRDTFNSKAEDYFAALVNIKGAIAAAVNADIGTAATTANWTSVDSRPTSLTTLNSTDGNKLSGIEAGADVTDYGSTSINNNYVYYTNLQGTKPPSDADKTSSTTINNAIGNSTLSFSDAGKITFASTANYLYSGLIAMRLMGPDVTVEARQNLNLYSAYDITSKTTGSGKDIILDCGSYSSDTAGIVDIKTAGTSRMFVKQTGFFPRSTNVMYLGYTANRWKEVHATSFHDNGGGYNDTLDDLAILAEFKPRMEKKIDPVMQKETKVAVVDPKNNSNFLDLNSLPDWLLDKDGAREKLKADNGDLLTAEDIEELLLDYNGAGWMIGRNVSAFNDLTNGAVRQLDIEMKQLIELMASRITSLENEIRTLKGAK
jgi:hypothetical protein